MKVAGIDIGSATAKALILHNDNMYYSIRPVKEKWQHEGENILKDVLSKARMDREELDCIIATGSVEEEWDMVDSYLSDVSCASNGARYLFPTARTVIDIGAEACRVTRFDEMSLVMDYRMNQKCGSGTGLFLDVVADALEVDIEAIGEMSLEATKRINMNSACAVFAESEVVSLIHQGEKRSDILSAVFHMIAAKTAALAKAARLEEDVVFSGGVAKNVGMVKAMSDVLGTKILVPENPDLLNALGAALEAKEML